ncbi:hypothetical protein [Streptomyces shenzhenensis]|uniref:hypothetical protein n=1 Tax=Streptomyces shenzhenensis TaxID=943815 RepID=UPI0015F05B26|nr:hypothetical protein [Streptomyces shenzhenensis]
MYRGQQARQQPGRREPARLRGTRVQRRGGEQGQRELRDLVAWERDGLAGPATAERRVAEQGS